MRMSLRVRFLQRIQNLLPSQPVVKCWSGCNN